MVDGDELVAAPGRRDAIDVARVLALVVVVVGHLSLAVIDRADGEVRGANLLELRPGWAWVAAAAPMPVFFAAAGWANATATAPSAAPRLRLLAALGGVVVGVWAVAVAAAVAITGESGVVGDGARISTQPLWFLAAYAPMAASGRRLADVATRHPIVTLMAGLGVLAALDVARFTLDAPRWVGWPGFFVAWSIPWLAGSWWRARVHQGDFAERLAGAVLLVAAGACAVALVRFLGYDSGLIDVVHEGRSNTTPPTLYTAVAALAQVGALLIVAGSLDRLGRRWRSLWDRAGEAAVGLYVWHLTALSLCGGLLALGVPSPERLTGWWWATRPLWFALVLGMAGGFVALTAKVTRGSERADRAPRTPIPHVRAALGTLVLCLAAAGVGLEGPREPVLAVAWTALFALAWRLLSPPR